MACRVADIIGIMEELAPPAGAEEWDNVGLLAGSSQAEVSRVLVSLDATREVVAEAGAKGAGLIVCHHPPLFRPLTRLVAEDPITRPLYDAVASGISVYAAHTNLDASELGVSVVLAELLRLVGHRPLERSPGPEAYKLVTFVPPEHAAAVGAAVFRAGGGKIGAYTGCSFRVEGTGTFTPGPGSRPAYGEAGGPNELREVRLEVRVEGGALEAAVAGLLESHPYEEPAYDVYPLLGPSRSGLGRVGDLPGPMSLGELAGFCSRELANPAVRLAGDPERRVTRVAVCGGSGGKLAASALQAGAEVLVTGDVGYHDALDAAARGLAVIDAGHYQTEMPALRRLASLLEAGAREGELAVAVLLSDTRTCPWDDGGAA